MNEKREEIAEVLVDFATALEAACVNLKRYALELVNAEDKHVWDADKIKWIKAQSGKGEYERADGEQNKGVVDFDNLVADLKAHNGKLSRLGFFYWLFEQTETPTVGRKPLKKAVQ
ncbi:MAG: hypothetical protein QW166_01545 [Candidatus Bathyarchaeia archaeon]